jgi:hypothetical protein
MIAASIGYAEKQEMAKDWCIPKKEGFFEPVNTVITEMFVRWLNDYVNNGVPTQLFLKRLDRFRHFMMRFGTPV